mmetsp:Transcript_36614/g.88731  ORF Transcript_36614/g.88731 Transcript_36614/m.88731 type:complete len:297 (-) Transcript_36614:10-900(-)
MTEMEAVTIDPMMGGLRIVAAATMIVRRMAVQDMPKTIGIVAVTLIIVGEVGINHLVVPGTVSNLTEATEIESRMMNHPNVEEAMKSKIEIDGVGSLSSAQTTGVIGTTGMPRTVVAVEITMDEEIGSEKKVVEGWVIPDQMEIETRTAIVVMTEGVTKGTIATVLGTMIVTPLISVTVVVVVEEKGMDVPVGTPVLEILADTVVVADTQMNPATIIMAEAVEKRRSVDNDTKATTIMMCAKRIAETSTRTGTVARTNRTGRSEHWSNRRTGVTTSSLPIRSVELRTKQIRIFHFI